jgi:hypothetical protein
MGRTLRIFRRDDMIVCLLSFGKETGSGETQIGAEVGDFVRYGAVQGAA